MNIFCNPFNFHTKTALMLILYMKPTESSLKNDYMRPVTVLPGQHGVGARGVG